MLGASQRHFVASSFRLFFFFFFLWAAVSFQASSAAYNVVDFGERADGKADSTHAFAKAWSLACNSVRGATIYVPKGSYLVKVIEFKGPCKSKVSFLIDGTIVAPTNYWSFGSSGFWILFYQVNRGASLVAPLMPGELPSGLAGLLAKVVLLVLGIGSLAEHTNEGGVQNVTVAGAVFSGTQNGVRIKSWGRPSTGFAKDVVFRNIVINKSYNPIIIDQRYCPSGHGCPSQNSGVKISGVTYKNVRGTSASKTAMNFSCSASQPCQGLRLQNIRLTYLNRADATSSCSHAHGTNRGVVIPTSCL